MSEQAGFGKVVLINLVLVVASAAILSLLSQFIESSAFFFAIIYLAQVVINVVIGFARPSKNSSGYFLSALLVLIIGFGLCAGVLDYMSINKNFSS